MREFNKLMIGRMGLLLEAGFAKIVVETCDARMDVDQFPKRIYDGMNAYSRQ
jgi:hypothetical protein